MQSKRDILYTVIGAAAFVVGGIVTRSKALEMAEVVEGTFHKKDKELEAPPADL